MKISYITVTYNAAKLLPVTLASVLEQDYPDVEHIIVDGKSADDTPQLVSEYMAQAEATDSKHAIRFVCEHDSGIYDAMNKGLRLATGDYVCFLNAGDWLPQSGTATLITDMIASAEHDNGSLPAVVYGDTAIVNESGKMLGQRAKKLPKTLTWKSFRRGMAVCHQAFYARADLAKKLPYNLQYRFSADFDWCIRLMKEGERCGCRNVGTNKVVANYLEEGTTTAHRSASLKERFHIMQYHYGLTSTLFHHVLFAFGFDKR